MNSKLPSWLFPRPIGYKERSQIERDGMLNKLRMALNCDSETVTRLFSECGDLGTAYNLVLSGNLLISDGELECIPFELQNIGLNVNDVNRAIECLGSLPVDSAFGILQDQQWAN